MNPLIGAPEVQVWLDVVQAQSHLFPFRVCPLRGSTSQLATRHACATCWRARETKFQHRQRSLVIEKFVQDTIYTIKRFEIKMTARSEKYSCLTAPLCSRPTIQQKITQLLDVRCEVGSLCWRGGIYVQARRSVADLLLPNRLPKLEPSRPSSSVCTAWWTFNTRCWVSLAPRSWAQCIIIQCGGFV